MGYPACMCLMYLRQDNITYPAKLNIDCKNLSLLNFFFTSAHVGLKGIILTMVGTACLSVSAYVCF